MCSADDTLRTKPLEVSLRPVIAHLLRLVTPPRLVSLRPGIMDETMNEMNEMKCYELRKG